MVVCKLIHFYKADKTINDILLKSLTSQTRQINWDGGSNILTRLFKELKYIYKYKNDY